LHSTEQLNAALQGRYLVERRVGEGGMATVYLARDVKHDRKVALKVLKPELGAVLGVERFLSEIKVTANLQHPNLLALFDSGESDGLLYYVMPFIEGESLRVKLDREKQLPIDEAVRLTVAVASALDYAHRHGVIHRDLKPENILLHDGQPVIADFGIALAVSNAGGARVTQTGLSLGTPQYMSPEQASGDRAIDARSDIYSLAAVLYEMIAGEPPHTGNTAQAIMAKLMTAEPAPLSTLRKSAPVHVEAAVERALSKLPADRFSTAKEFAEAIEGRGFSLSATSAARTPTHRGVPAKPVAKHPAFLIAAGLAAIGLTVAGMQWRRAAAAEAASPVVRFQLELPNTPLTNNAAGGTNLAISPDGKTIAYIGVDEKGVSRVHLRAIDEVEGRPLPGTEAAGQPFFSPDGNYVGYVANNEIFKVQVSGGPPSQLGPPIGSPNGQTWSSGGWIVAATSQGLWGVSDDGANSRLLAKPDSARGEQFFNVPVALPGGEHIAFSIYSGGGLARARFAVLTLKTGEVTRFPLAMIAPLGVVDDVIAFVDPNGALSTVQFDARRLEISGQPTPAGITALVRASGAVQGALSPSGTLIYESRSPSVQLGWVDQRGLFTSIGAEPRAYAYPRLSPDGKRVATSIYSGGRSDIWVYELAAGTPMRITTDGAVNERPEWSRDGTRLIYRSDRGKLPAIWWQPADPGGKAEPLVTSDRHSYYEAVLTPDDKAVVLQVDDAGANQADVVWRAVGGDTTDRVIAGSSFVEAQPRLSSDGKWVAFVSDASGVPQVVVQPFPGPGAQAQVSVSGGTEPVWSRDGKKLFYRDGLKLVEATVATAPSFRVVSRASLFNDLYVAAPSPHANYDVAADGRFLMVRNAQTPRLTVVYGWAAELRARLKN
jgi:Tol biopolymer transport system component/tRNA A-37 threonylcarbamoyl transferase component Bud32